MPSSRSAVTMLWNAWSASTSLESPSSADANRDIPRRKHYHPVSRPGGIPPAPVTGPPDESDDRADLIQERHRSNGHSISVRVHRRCCNLQCGGELHRFAAEPVPPDGERGGLDELRP